MAIACAVIGMIVVTFLNLTASSVPEALQVTAVKVLVPAANLLVNIVDACDLLVSGDRRW
ncbi:Putative inner membrane protein [Salmonella enterica subsp. enterica]|uniref:Inner membrane protein n=1 Tax=Salmonella enterica I TaxID=59201 RepID=A0A447MZ99_SALET|nr:Putative inner membrane protein [Salmonella enterica subsp. enterica]